MRDVKSLIKISNFYLIINLILLTVATAFYLIKNQIRQILGAYQMGSLITVAAILILGIFSALDFDLVFINFHKIFFRNDLWQLPEGSNLLKLFPPEFFQAFANRIAYQTIIAAILIFLITSLAKNHVAKKH